MRRVDWCSTESNTPERQGIDEVLARAKNVGDELFLVVPPAEEQERQRSPLIGGSRANKRGNLLPQAGRSAQRGKPR